MKKIVLDNALCGPWTAERLGAKWVGEAAVCIGLWEFPDNPLTIPPSLCEGKQVAGVIFSDFNHASIQMHVASEPGARWMTKPFLGFCFQYAFHQAKVKKILGFVGEGNASARSFDEHIGFRLAAEIPDAHPTGSLLIYEMTEADCRWLSIPLKMENLYGKT